ncbi:P-loop containing nucleoside triphosphate hydrolase protein [Cladorrhinum samala]|uniref:P-loop containing nucleoside triphosphate hydrolase protein n=1 Tax=Cladorrhinum samala TaxID=585594 RepID=A0AAV9HEP9_9PEZI|nr:P-loop containing nucleoside triphosphate hydrolase protein [Cladorrhinum samala]
MLGQLFSTWHPAARAWPISHTVKLRRVHQTFLFGGSLRCFTNTNNLLATKRKQKRLFTPSKEQQEIAKLCSTNNVVVSARPGSGKTATAEAIVAAHPDKRVAVLTYSKRLQLETQRRLRSYSNCEVFTFHAMAGLLFGTLVRDDVTLMKQRKLVRSINQLPWWNLEPFDIIVLDEFQDCTELIFWLTNCFILANNQNAEGQPARLVVLGDERQSIFGFRGADERYLTLAPDILSAVSPYPFVSAQLNRSFRLSDPSVRFINNTFLGGESYITSFKPGPKPVVLRCYHNSSALAKQLSLLISRYGPKNSAIIAPAVRSDGLLKDTVNALSGTYGVPIAVSIDDEVPLDDRVIKGKLCVSTIHQFKGSERDLVILFNIDSSFFDFLGRDLPDDRCPNEVFVALTRAAEQLVLVHPEGKEIMPFASVEALYESADVINLTRNPERIQKAPAPDRPLEPKLSLPPSITAQAMARHVKGEHLDPIIHHHLHIQVLSSLPDDQHIKPPNVVISDRERGFYEAVSDLNGLVVAAASEYAIAGTFSTLGLGIDEMTGTVPELCSREGVSWLSRNACDYVAAVSGYRPRLNQMVDHDFDWISPDDLALAHNRLRQELSGDIGSLTFEADAGGTFSIGDQICEVFGRADIVADSPISYGDNAEAVKTVWELKFVAELSNQHVVQACIYAHFLGAQRILLYNMRNGQKWEVTPHGPEDLRRLIERVLILKYTTTRKTSDEEFAEMCRGVSSEVLSLRT